MFAFVFKVGRLVGTCGIRFVPSKFVVVDEVLLLSSTVSAAAAAADATDDDAISCSSLLVDDNIIVVGLTVGVAVSVSPPSTVIVAILGTMVVVVFGIVIVEGDCDGCRNKNSSVRSSKNCCC